jgi:hypothetical protein
VRSVCVFALATATLSLALLSGCGGSSSNRSDAATRACTTPRWSGPGIGWRAFASSSLSCQSAVHLMRAYFAGGIAMHLVPKTVQGYACTVGTFGTHSLRVRCVHDGATAIAVENH